MVLKFTTFYEWTTEPHTAQPGRAARPARRVYTISYDRSALRWLFIYIQRL